MDDVRPDNLNPEELLSAYLDGEVTAAERAQVEQLLASDPEARAALEELRALSAALQSLPKLSVGEDLSERVLRRAERAMLERQTVEPNVAPTATGQVSPAPKTISEQGASLLERGTHGAGWTRRLAWPLAAVAAALLVMIVSQKPKSEIALAPVPNASPSKDAVMRSSRIAEEESESFEGDNATAEASGEFASRDAAPTPSESSADQFRDANRTVESQLDSVASEMKSARGAGKSAAESSKHLENSVEGAVQPKPKLAFGKAGQGGRNAAPPAAPASDIAGTTVPSPAALSSAPGADAATSDAATSDAMPAKGQASAVGDRVEMVVEILAANDAVEVSGFDDLLAMQNIRLEGYEADQRRKDIGHNSLSTENELTKDRTAEKNQRDGSLADAERDKESTRQAKARDKAGQDASEQKLAELKELEKSSPQTEPSAEPLEAKPGAAVATREVKKGMRANQPADASTVDGLSNSEPLHLGDEAAGEAGAVPQSAEVEVILVTATPAQVRGLLQEIDSRSSEYRASAVENGAARQLAEGRPTTLQDKRDANGESLAANRAAQPAEKKSQAAADEKAKTPLGAATPAGSAWRWRVSEDQLASLLSQESLDRSASSTGMYRFNAESAEQLAQATLRGAGGGGGGGGQGLAQKRERSALAEDAEEAADAPAEVTLRDDAAAGGGQEEPAEDSALGTKSDGPAASAPTNAESKVGTLRGPARRDLQQGKVANQPRAKVAVESETPAAPLLPGKPSEEHFGQALGVDPSSRTRLEEQLKETAEDEQIRVLFVLRGRVPGALQSQSDATGQAPAIEIPPNAASEPSPAAEAAPGPAEADPPKE